MVPARRVVLAAAMLMGLGSCTVLPNNSGVGGTWSGIDAGQVADVLGDKKLEDVLHWAIGGCWPVLACRPLTSLSTALAQT